MGGSYSNPLLTEVPWRRFKSWDKRQIFKDEIQSLVPRREGDIQVSCYKIILAGTVSAGKSSFVNSINSIFTERVVLTAAAAGSAATSVTSQYFEHKIYKDGTPLAFKICDTMGLTKHLSKVDVDNIIAAMDGHVPHKHEFTHDERFKPSSSGYIENPSIADMAHCVAFVANATTIKTVEEEVLQNLRYLWEELNKRKVPMFIILTHVDKKCLEVKKDVKNVYRSIVVRDLVKWLSNNICSIPGAQIFPVVNYKDQVEMENDMDVLALFALRQMLYAAQANLDNK